MTIINIQDLSRCQQCFIKALLALLEKKSFDTITIKELAKKADYDRKTFYRHFTKKEDILKLYCGHILQKMSTSIKNRGPLTFKTYILSYFEFWDKHIDFLYLLEKNHLLHFLGDLQDDLIYQHVEKNIQPEIPETLEAALDYSKYAYYFTQGGLWNILVHWIKENSRNAPEQLTAHILDYLKEAQNYIE